MTAQRRAQSIQDVPASIQAFQGESLLTAGIDNASDLQTSVPGLTITPFQSEANVFIRGIGNNITSPSADPSNAVHLNGVYLSRPALALAYFYDVDRVEVLKGPQGTLYGRNATGGAINILTNQPTEDFEGYLSAGIGSFSARRAEAGLNLPFENGAFRIAGLYSADDGYTNNLFDNRKLNFVDAIGARARVRFAPTSSISVTAGIDYSRDNGNVGLPIRNDVRVPQAYSSLSNATGPRDYNLDALTGGEKEATIGDLQVAWTGAALEFRSITGVVSFDILQQLDTDGSASSVEQVLQFTSTQSVSQEFQLLNKPGGRLTWILGAHFQREESDETFSFEIVPIATRFVDDRRSAASDSYAVFGEATYNVTDKLGLTLGGRYSLDDKEATVNDTLAAVVTKASDSFSEFTPRAVMTYKASDDVNLYASVSRGFKSGGFDMTFAPDAFDKETVTAWEVGLRSELLDRALKFNASAFYYDYKDIQLGSSVEVTPGVFSVEVANAPKSTIRGVEIDSAWQVTKQFGLRLNYGWTDSEFGPGYTTRSGVDMKGKPLPNTPEHKVVVGADYSFSVADFGDLTLSAGYSWQSEFLSTSLRVLATEQIDGYGLVDASVRFDSANERWFASVSGQNLTDETYDVYRADFSAFSNMIQVDGAPRTVMATLGVRF